MHTDCKRCFFIKVQKILTQYNTPNSLTNCIMTRVNRSVNKNRYNNILNTKNACFQHWLIKEETDTVNYYQKDNKKYNRLMLNLQEDISKDNDKSGNPFQTTLCYVMAGNIIDYTPQDSFDMIEKLEVKALKLLDINHYNLWLATN
jgi:uncharacterized protein with ATP-grasp and redox domains